MDKAIAQARQVQAQEAVAKDVAQIKEQLASLHEQLDRLEALLQAIALAEHKQAETTTTRKTKAGG